MSAPALTPRQREALAWLPTVGKATPMTLKRHGYSLRTMYALAQRGLIEQEYRPTGRGSGFPVFRPKGDS